MSRAHRRGTTSQTWELSLVSHVTSCWTPNARPLVNLRHLSYLLTCPSCIWQHVRACRLCSGASWQGLFAHCSPLTPRSMCNGILRYYSSGNQTTIERPRSSLGFSCGSRYLSIFRLWCTEKPHIGTPHFSCQSRRVSPHRSIPGAAALPKRSFVQSGARVKRGSMALKAGDRVRY